MTATRTHNRLALIELYGAHHLEVAWCDLGDRRRTELQLFASVDGALEPRGRRIAIPNSAIFYVSDAIVKATLLASRERR